MVRRGLLAPCRHRRDDRGRLAGAPPLPNLARWLAFFVVEFPADDGEAVMPMLAWLAVAIAAGATLLVSSRLIAPVARQPSSAAPFLVFQDASSRGWPSSASSLRRRCAADPARTAEAIQLAH